MVELRRWKETAPLGLTLCLYALVRIVEVVTSTPRISVVALDVLSAMAFALFDGARHYGWRGILVFAGICALIGNTVENIGIATGFPFGRYEFLELMGPKLFHVPVLLGLAYVGMAYVSWMLARLILGQSGTQLRGAHVLSLPVVATCIMVAWDWAQDPVWATLLYAWRWRDGGAWFGVPLSNYAGWSFTIFLIYVAFAFYLRRRMPGRAPLRRMASWPPVLFYGMCAVGNAIQLFKHFPQQTVMDATGKSWRVADILAASALVSIFAMGGFVLAAASRLVREQVPVTD